ncbi:hypothetical protein LPJ60_005123, partial [Coemansia sp. RSA 2675]
MHIKKIALRAMVLGMVAVAVMATNEPVDWEGPCTDAAIVANWKDIRTRFRRILDDDDDRLSDSKRRQVYKLLNNSYYLPYNPDLVLKDKLFDIVGSKYMQYAIGEILNKYWRKHPCVTPTPTTSSSTSSIYSTVTSSDIYSTVTSSDIYSTVTSSD